MTSPSGFLHAEFGLMFDVTQTALKDDRYDMLVEYVKWLGDKWAQCGNSVFHDDPTGQPPVRHQP